MTSFVGSQSGTFPYSAVVFLEVTFASGNVYTGSGVMVGPNDVLTAAHVVYSDSEGAAVNVRVSAGYNNGNAPFGTIAAAEWNYFDWDFNGDDLLTRAESEFDLAIVGLSTTLGNQTGWFGMSTNYSSGYYNLSGYPGVYTGTNGARLTNDYGLVNEDPVNYVFNYVSVESNPGNSGGPLWYQGSNGPYVVGIASTGSWAADITKNFNQIQQWIAGNDDLIQTGPPSYILQVGRLYEAGLSRQFDAPGLNYWIDQYEAGASLLRIGGLFLDSAEFTSRFGDDDLMTNTQFVNAMYNNTLGRGADASGLQYWLGQMGNGMSRELVLLQFSESAENLGQSGYLQSLQQTAPGYWTL